MGRRFEPDGAYSGFMNSRIPHRSLQRSRVVIATAFVAASVSIAALTGCASPSATSTTSNAATVPSPAATVSSVPLLTKTDQTVLGQPITYPTAQPAQVSSVMLTIPPGVETGLHKHDAPMYAYILEGELTVAYDNGATKTYLPGEAIMEALGTPHNGRNSGTTDAKLIVVFMGADGVANTTPLP